MYRPTTKWQWAFILIALAQAIVVLAFEAYIFATFQEDVGEHDQATPEDSTLQPKKTIPTFLTLFIFGLLYQLLLVYDALQQKNTIQIIGLCLYNVLLLIYGSVQKDQLQAAVDGLAVKNEINREIFTQVTPYLIAIPCILALGTVLLAGVAWKLYEEFAWKIYKHISADLRLKRRYLTYQIYITLLKFDFFFFLGFTVQFVVVVIDEKALEFALTVAAIPVTIIILVMAAFFTRRENTWGMISTIILYFGGLGYFIFKIFRIYSDARKEQYRPVAKEITTFAALTIILIVVTIINACMCTHNFNKGLKPYILETNMDHEDEKPGHGPTYGTEMSGGPLPGRPPTSRMEID